MCVIIIGVALTTGTALAMYSWIQQHMSRVGHVERDAGSSGSDTAGVTEGHTGQTGGVPDDWII